MPLSLSLPGKPACRRLALALTRIACHALVPFLVPSSLLAQQDLRINPDSLAINQGRLGFQFAAPGGTTSDFEVWSRPGLEPAESWAVRPEATLDAITEGLYQVSVPLLPAAPPAAATFFRIRRIGLPPPAPAPVFNEVMSDNRSAFTTPDGRHLDWIELFNPHDEAVALDGLQIRDGSSSSPPWSLPAGHLQPGAFLLILASDDPATPAPSGGLLAPFGLASSGESLVLSDRSGRELDRVEVPPLNPDQAIGRIPDGAARWGFLPGTQSTPGTTNSPLSTGVVVPAPEFSIDGGFHPAGVEVRLESREPGGVVRYTRDGSPAVATSTVAAGLLRIDQTTVIRAATFDTSGNSSEERVRTFLIGPRRHSGWPVISLAAPPSNFEFKDGYLFGMTSQVVNNRGEVLQSYPFNGSNAWKDREVVVSLELFEPDGTPGLRQRAGLKVYGGWGSRGYPQKSLALLARREYAAGSFKHDLFPGTGVDNFESFVLRNSGNDNQSTHQIPPRPPITPFGTTRSYGSYFVNGTFTLMRDGLMQRLLQDHTRLDGQAYRPAVVYLNGQYWGIYNLREKLNEHHVLAHHDLPRGSIDLIEGYGEVRAGDATAYRALRDFVNTRSMAVETNYQHVASTWLGIDNFIDYHLAVIYFQNFDIGNIKCWRPRTPHGRFHWMVYDQDYGFGLWPAKIYEPAMARDYADYANMFKFATAGTGTSTGWPNAGGRTLLLRRLLANPGFRDRFIRRCADLLNTAFREDRVVSLIDVMAGVLRPEIPAHLQRWSWDELTRQGYGAPYQREYQSFTQATWETNLTVLREFAISRPALVRSQCAAHFGLGGGIGTLSVRVDPPNAGAVQLNSLLLTNSAWNGTYFVALTNTLQAIARPGFRVRGWTADTGFTASPFLSAVVSAGQTNTVVAEFEPLPAPPAPAETVWITEINYHAPDNLDADDWIELHNPGRTSINLEGWVLRDQQDDSVCVLPRFELAPGASCVLARSVVKFQWAHPDASDPIASFDFGLGNSGDTVRLFDPAGIEVQRVAYRDEAPWPVTADGQGSTLQRLASGSDPSLASSWIASPIRGGTPGRHVP